ncbi:hypothetical protein EAE96_002698 [Botrytis aclada]|nr:hypothetical protein EAE96_002698 [Botrytis aclada]
MEITSNQRSSTSAAQFVTAKAVNLPTALVRLICRGWGHRSAQSTPNRPIQSRISGLRPLLWGGGEEEEEEAEVVGDHNAETITIGAILLETAQKRPTTQGVVTEEESGPPNGTKAESKARPRSAQMTVFPSLLLLRLTIRALSPIPICCCWRSIRSFIALLF